MHGQQQCHCSGLLDWQEQLKFRWQLLFAVQPVTEVDATNAAVGMNLHIQGLNVICTWQQQIGTVMFMVHDMVRADVA